MTLTKGGVFALIYIILILVLLKISPFIFGAVIFGVYFAAILAVPTKFFINKLKMKEGVARWISNILFLLVITFAFINFFPVIMKEWTIVLEKMKDFSVPNTDNQIPKWIIDILNSINSKISSIGMELLNKVLSYTPLVVTAFLITLITAASLDGLKSYIGSKLWILFPASERDDGVYFIKKSYTDFVQFVQGQFLVATILGTIVGLAALVFGIPGSLFLGVLSWITDFLPFIGIFIAMIPMIVIGFSVKGITGLIIGILIIFLANQLEMWVLGPRVQSSNLKIHWFVVFMTVLLFADMFGAIGSFVALPILLVIINFWKIFVIPQFKKY